MKLLFLSHSVSGEGTYMRQMLLGRELARAGHDVTLSCVRGPDPGGPHGREPGLRIIETRSKPNLPHLGYWNRWLHPGILTRAGRAVAGGYDVIMAGDHWPEVGIPFLLARQVGIRGLLIADWADWWTEGGLFASHRLRTKLGYRAEHALELRTKTVADGVTVIAESLYQRALDLGIPEDRLLLLPSGANLEEIRPMERRRARHEVGLPLDAPVVGYMGRTSPERLPVFFEVFRLLTDRVARARALVLGSEKPSWAAGSEMSTITFAGVVPSDRLSPYLASADVWVIPYGEGLPFRTLWPNRLLDFMAAGRPVVATDHPDLHGLFEECRIGLLAESKTADLANKIAQILERPDGGQAMGTAAREVAEARYSWRSVAGQFVSFVNRLHSMRDASGRVRAGARKA